MRTQKKIKIALTGGIGTGKTYVSKHFLDIGIPVFYADDEAKKLYTSKIVLNFFAEKYGERFFTNEKLDLSKVAHSIFANPENRKEIESFIHPLVMQEFEEWTNKQSSSIVMMESAIIIEVGLKTYFDKIIVVDAPLDIRISRIKARYPQLSEQDILQRINTQIPQEEKCKHADIVING